MKNSIDFLSGEKVRLIPLDSERDSTFNLTLAPK